jgi:hypothetical protein
MKQRTHGWTDLEDDCIAEIKSVMYHRICEHAVANIININKVGHILLVVGTIL